MTETELQENALLNAAIIYATQCHASQLRKGTSLPYIIHPLEVMHILLLMSADKALLAAGVLHDTVEDTDATLEDIEAQFGKDIAQLVASHTEMHKELPWRQRKTQALAECAKANTREQMLVLADKLANVRAMTRNFAELGDKLWTRFNKGPKEQAWYYHGGVKALANLADFPNTAPFYEELKNLVYNLFGEPEAEILEGDLSNQELVIAETKETYVTVNLSEGALILNGEEFGSSDIGSDSYEYSVSLNKENTSKLLLQIRKDFGQDITLKDIFKNHICINGRYFTFLRYCEKYNINYNMESF